MQNGDFKSRLKNILKHHEGRGRAITGKELAGMLGQRDDRKVRLVIRELIAEGLPVISATESPAGYYLAASINEVREYADGLRSRLIEDARRRRDVLIAGNRYLTPAEQGRLI